MKSGKAGASESCGRAGRGLLGQGCGGAGGVLLRLPTGHLGVHNRKADQSRPEPVRELEELVGAAAHGRQRRQCHDGEHAAREQAGEGVVCVTGAPLSRERAKKCSDQTQERD